jgi:predicted nucleotide-binding protein
MDAFASLVTPPGSADPVAENAEPQEEVFMIAQPAPVSVQPATAATAAPQPAPSPMTTMPTAPATPRQTPSPRLSSSGLLVLRSVDDQTRQAVARFFAALDLTLNVVDQRPAENRRPLVEALAQFADASFALILNDTPTNDGDYLFDLGCCVGKFGTGRLCLLQREDASPQPPGDSRGVKQIRIDPAGGWQLALARHLKSGGVAVDLNKLL